jgi:RecG-like helicase
VADDRAEKPSRLRGLWSRLSSTVEEQDAADLRTTSRRLGVLAMGAAPDRRRVTVHGAIRSVTIRPRTGTSALEAELYDGTGAVTLVFLGRRQVSGVECGRTLTATGLVTRHQDHRVMFNPRYELDPATVETR